MTMRGSTRRRSLLAAVAAAASCCGLLPAAAAAAPGGAPPIAGSQDEPAAAYYRLLERHTRWAETVWDQAAGSYQLKDFNFAVVLGNAVLLKFGDYDAAATGISYDALRDHTLRTIARFAASNRFVDPNGNWGGQIFWDATFESYFVAAARIMWEDLDPVTRADVERIAAGEADYVAGLGDTEDPRSGGWSSNGLLGGWRSDSKIEEMGAKTMPLATGLANAPDAPGAARWREWLNRWTMSMTGLPAADRANTTPIDGTPISDWTTAHNVFDSFLVENHGAFAPMYQESVGAYPGRNAVHFLLNGEPLPASLRSLPSGDELWRALDRVGADAGVPEDLMVDDRHHLYGRNVLPLAYRSVVAHDADAARAERMLADHLDAYVAYPPANRLTKFSGEPKYEPEARAEVAMAYLLHYGRAAFGGGADPVSEQRYFADNAGTTDFGADAGLIAQQTPSALAAAVTKPGYVKFAFLPQHDDWFLDGNGKAPSLIPSTATKVTARRTHEYRAARDGVDATATLLRTQTGWAGYTTLPGGRAVYATSGLATDEGALRLYNLDMPGVPGLDGDRTFTAADGSATLAATTGLGDGGVDDVAFPATRARYVRFIGTRPATVYGYSLFDFEVHDAGGPDLARGAPTTASSYDPTAPGPFRPEFATDGNPATRWAVAKSERARPDSWLAVDLGAERDVSRVVLRFESAYAAGYRIQVSDDGATWRDAASVPDGRTFHGDWLNIDGRAGFVIRHSDNPIAVTPTSAVLSSGPAAGAAGMVVEASPAQSPQDTAADAGRPAPSGGPAALRASLAGGDLSLFNLSDEPIDHAALEIPAGAELPLFAGVQRTREGGTAYDVSLDAADARVEPPRFRVRARHDGEPLPALRADVRDSRTVTLESLAGEGVAQVELVSAATGEAQEVTVPAGEAKTVVFHDGLLTPSADLARARTTFPSSPLPPGMSDPDLAVDGDDATAWTPGPGGRMVVDLGQTRELGVAVLRWTAGRALPARISVSDDGVDYRDAGTADPEGRLARAALSGSARYVAIAVPGWTPGDARLASAGVFADAAAAAGEVSP
jgi:hypothetical protein